LGKLVDLSPNAAGSSNHIDQKRREPPGGLSSHVCLLLPLMLLP
jgi:hypothetical protein